jgi:Ca2+-binding EF-hand superfamily protein
MSEVGDPSKAKQDDQPGNFDDLVETLSQFDIDGKGMVQAAELRHILTALGKLFHDNC